MSIRARLLVLVLAVWLPAVLGFVLVGYGTYRKAAETARQGVQQSADRLSAAIESELDKQAALASALANSAALRERNFVRFHDEAVASSDASKRWIFLVEERIQVDNSLLPAPKTVARVAGAPFARDGVVVAYASRGPVTNGPVVGIFAAELTKPARYNVGVSVATEGIQQLVTRQEFPLGSIGTVLNADHVVLARSRDNAKWAGVSATGEMKQRMLSGRTGFAPSVTLEGLQALSYVTAPNRYAWTIVVALPTSTLEGAARKLTLQTIAASGLLLLLGLALAFYVSRQIGSSILQLRDAALDLSRNDVPEHLPTLLTEANDVAKVLREAGVRILDAKTALEKRVADAVAQAEQTQARLLESQKREAIGRLAGGLAHDFNNLLQTITISLEIVQRTVPSGRHDRALQSAEKASLKAAELVRQIQSFGRSPSLEPQPVVLSDFVLECTSIMRNALGQGIELSASLDPALPPALIDPTQFELALLNLIFNARDALPKGGHVVIRGRFATSDEVAHLIGNAYIAVEVSDNGTGIPADVLPRMFEPYFTTKPMGTGTGLGLGQVRAFVAHCNGDTRVESIVGEGTRVIMLLPAATHRAIPPVVDAAAGVARKSLRILMVEDDALVSSVIVPALEAKGHTVDLSTSADDAMLRLANGSPVDVLFTDIVMPGRMNGLDLAEWTREHRPDIGVVVATGYTPRLPDPGMKLLRKPYRTEALLDALAGASPRGNPRPGKIH